MENEIEIERAAKKTPEGMVGDAIVTLYESFVL